MSRMFDSYIVVDWSAASTSKTDSDSIWIGVLMPDARFRLQFAATNPSTRFEAVEQLGAALERLTRRGDRVLVGFDFPLGYPAGTASALELTGEDAPWARMHAFLTSEMKEKADNSNNRFPLASRMNRKMSGEAFPFWGCPKSAVSTTLSDKKTREHGDGEPAEFRICERMAMAGKRGRPQPVWKLHYPGNCGGQAITGIPSVQKLRRRFADTSAIWPFETGFFANGSPETGDAPQVLFAEAYPSSVEVKPEPSETKDRAQVRALTQWFAGEDQNGRLARLLEKPTSVEEDDLRNCILEEGWILGI